MTGRVVLAGVVALMMAACSGGAEPAGTTVDPAVPLEEAADDYAVSADRALEGSAFEDLPDEDLAGLIVDLCGSIATSADPDATIAGAVSEMDPLADPEDMALLLEVVAIGLSEVCPDRVLAANAAGGGDPEDAYAAIVIPVALDAAGEDAPAVADLFMAGNAVCGALDEGGTAEDAALAAIEVLFGVGAGSLGEAESQVPGWSGDVVGTILGAASTIICPEHAGTVVEFVEEAEA